MSAAAVGSIPASNSQPGASAPKKELGKDDFLKLFVTRLRYQNPLEPVNDEQFIAQMAQFSSLEQMQNMNASLGDMVKRMEESNDSINTLVNLQLRAGQFAALNQAVSFLGKAVTLSVDGGTTQGSVQKIVSEQGVPKLMVNNQLYDMSQVIEVNFQVNNDVK